ncbi:polyubiquitin-B-like [Ptychodera flava]|uniref:polyubiquitin-B-like n=1 Tax=Ptychodera flava TaxID=63121 RepID=UPI00396A61F9
MVDADANNNGSKQRWTFRQESYGFIVPPEGLLQRYGQQDDVDGTGSGRQSPTQPMVIPITIKTQYNEEFTLRVNEGEYVNVVKAMITEHTGIEPKHQRLTYRGHQLQDDKMLLEYDIEKNGIINIYRCAEKVGKMTITIRNLREEDTKVEVEPLSTVLETKELFADEVHIPVPVIAFVYTGQILDNNLTLYDYNIMASSVIYVAYRSYPIIIRTLRRRSYQVAVNPSTTVWEIKAKIYENEGINVDDQHLVYGGRELFDDYDLHFYSATRPYAVLMLVTGDVKIIRKGDGRFTIEQGKQSQSCTLQ